MIGNMAVRITADRPNFPLGTLFVRAGSAANIALVGVPVRPGVNVTALALRVENVDGATADYAARAIGGVWVVDVPAAHFATVGSVTGGVSVWATGTGADGETSRTWCVGVGDLEVLSADADAPAPAPGQTFWPLRMFDAAPASPTKYNAYIDGAALKIWNGVAWITISGGSGTVDDTVTRTSANPVKSSGIWGAIWGTLTALPAGITSLYDWCKSFFVHVSAIAPKWDGGGTYRVGDVCMEGELPDGSGLLYRCKKAYTATSESDAPSHDTEHWEPVDVTALIAEKQNALSSAQLANIAAVTGKADAADLRYRIAEAGYDQQNDIYTLADRTVNTISTYNQTSLDIGLPDAVTVDGVSYARDFFLDIDNSVNASDLALEFTGLGVDYGFAPLEDDSISEMMTIGAGGRVRLYFTETSYFATGASLPIPVIQVARVTLGDFVTSTTTQGGN